ncbi:hypothetical protein EVAR_22465_1 [Eumeta japonica]|uniref:Uncharacterized protein n=1 Tax=Eumeta variegata TaxID=151549 RepID=A0A4C1VCH7_EUMVA|nr:hypothetical protein EVAR_22465_1 [Eumeta japonica]
MEIGFGRSLVTSLHWRVIGDMRALPRHTTMHSRRDVNRHRRATHAVDRVINLGRPDDRHSRHLTRSYKLYKKLNDVTQFTAPHHKRNYGTTIPTLNKQDSHMYIQPYGSEQDKRHDFPPTIGSKTEHDGSAPH